MYDSHHRLHHPLVDGSVISCDPSQKAHILVSLSPRPPSRAHWKLSVALNQSGIVYVYFSAIDLQPMGTSL